MFKKVLAVMCVLGMMIPFAACPITVSAAAMTDYSLADMQGHYKTQGLHPAHQPM